MLGINSCFWGSSIYGSGVCEIFQLHTSYYIERGANLSDESK
jgi:hypothetical protein